jgi:hypothetical protein
MVAAAAIAVGIWWTANTVSHLFIHRPFFRSRSANAAFAALLSAVLGFPQSVWRDRHLAHHGHPASLLRPRSVPAASPTAGGTQKGRRRDAALISGEVALQSALVVTLWTAMAVLAPAFFASAYVPGYLGGLMLCALHGHYEHAGGTTSHYGRLYNMLCFNDGYHVEHHLHPSARWTQLPARRDGSARASAWPAPMRWLDHVSLAGLERLTLRSRLLQRIVVSLHERAFRMLVADLPASGEVAIVGGGLFPRSALVVKRVLPNAHVTIIDADRAHLDRARAFLRDAGVTFVHARYPCVTSFDLMVFPLAFDGDRSELYARPPAPAVLVHDWIWRRRGLSCIVSTALLKRVNLVRA